MMRSLLDYLNVNSDDSVVRLRVAACTWAPESNISLLRNRASQLARAIQGWGSCNVSEICGDAFEGYTSSLLAFSENSVAASSVASLSDVLFMMPFSDLLRLGRMAHYYSVLQMESLGHISLVHLCRLRGLI